MFCTTRCFPTCYALLQHPAIVQYCIFIVFSTLFFKVLLQPPMNTCDCDVTETNLTIATTGISLVYLLYHGEEDCKAGQQHDMV